MVGKAAGNDEQGVDPHIVAIADKARRQLGSGNGDPAQAIGVEGQAGGIGRAALLDLDERDHLSAPRDKVDFAAGGPHPAGEDVPAVKPQPPGGEAFRPPSAPFGLGPAQRLFSSARA